MLLKHFIIASAAMLALSLAGNANAAPKPATDNTVTQLATAASPMKGPALEKLYAGRTWKWKTGGGFFSSKKARGWILSGEQKQFSAWSGKGAATTHATVFAHNPVRKDDEIRKWSKVIG